jgi:glyoxylase-like metal-dependent hydrolase (beta-lactamase superfamily II)
MTAIALEDNFNDVLGKAVRGLYLRPTDVAARAGVDLPTLQRLLAGEFDEAAVRRVAPILDLGSEALVALGQNRYCPEVPAPAGLHIFNSPYDDFHVNAFLLVDPDSRQAVVFDTGSDGEAILQAAHDHRLTIALILLTHTHDDHIMCLETIRTETQAPAYVSAVEPAPGAQPLPEGKTFQVGRLTIEPRATTGHTRGGTSYYVTGLDRPIVVVGDALFAASMGNGNVSYRDALTNNRRQIFTLPDETVICPGHGPLTTVGLEKQNNPFYPEFASA